MTPQHHPVIAQLISDEVPSRLIGLARFVPIVGQPGDECGVCSDLEDVEDATLTVIYRRHSRAYSTPVCDAHLVDELSWQLRTGATELAVLVPVTAPQELAA